MNAQDRYLLESVCRDTGDVEDEKTSASNKTARLVSTLPVAKHREHCGRYNPISQNIIGGVRK